MRRKNIWLKKVLAVSVCAAMAFQPAVCLLYTSDAADD